MYPQPALKKVKPFDGNAALQAYFKCLGRLGYQCDPFASEDTLAAQNMKLPYSIITTLPSSDIGCTQLVGFDPKLLNERHTQVYWGAEFRLYTPRGISLETMKNVLTWLGSRRPHQFSDIYFKPVRSGDMIWQADFFQDSSAAKALVDKHFRNGLPPVGTLVLITSGDSTEITNTTTPIVPILTALKELEAATLCVQSWTPTLEKMWPC